MNRLFDLEELLGRKVDVDHVYTGWKEPFPGWREKWDIAHGRVPFVSWAKTSTSSVNSGRYDGLIRQRAADVKAFGHPHPPGMVLGDGRRPQQARRRFPGHSSSPPGSGSTASSTRPASTTSRGSGAPTPGASHTGEAQKFYPGDEYVDWICANGYNWDPARQGDEWRSFEWVFQDFYDWAAGRGKPLMIGEFGVQERKPGEKAEWLRDAADALKTKFPDIKAIVYFNVKKHHDWRIGTASARSAFKYLAKELQTG